MQQNKQYTVTMLVYLTAMVLLVLLQIVASLGWFNGLSDEALTVVSSVLPQIVIMFGVPFVMLLSAQKINGEPVSVRRVTEHVGWRKMSFKNVLLVFLLGVCLYLLNIFVASFFGAILQAFGYQYTNTPNVFSGWGGLLLTIVLSAVLPALCEEFLHRGVLLNGMIPQFGVHRSILLVSLLFGLMHMNVGQFFYAAVLGWFFCVTALSARSLWASVIVHFVNNALATYFSYANELQLPGVNALNFLLGNPVFMMLTILVAVVGIAEILRHLARENFERNLDAYTVRYLASQNQFNTGDFDKIKDALPRAIKTMPSWKATMAYIETFNTPQPTKPLPKALLWAVCVLGTIITVLSFMWGTW